MPLRTHMALGRALRRSVPQFLTVWGHDAEPEVGKLCSLAPCENVQEEQEAGWMGPAGLSPRQVYQEAVWGRCACVCFT